MEIIDQDFENILPVEEKPKKKILPRKMIFLGGLLFLLILILTAISLNLKQGRRSFSGTLPIPTPTPTPILIEKITNPSFYATDSAILKIEEELKKIEQELDSTDLKENSLNLPVLDWEVKF